MPKADAISAENVTRRLKQVSILRRLCLALGRAKVVSTGRPDENRNERSAETLTGENDASPPEPARAGD